MRRVVFLGLILVAAIGCRVSDVPIWDAFNAPSGLWEVKEKRDVAYYDGPGKDRLRHSLDLYVPEPINRKSHSPPGRFPVVVLVHGGAWMVGDNRCCGLYTAVARQLAEHGIVVAAINYRLTPQVKHPDHVKDVAKAVAWVQKEYGPDVFLMGHSAGGHLVSLLATDKHWLADSGGLPDGIRGVISVSGVYRIEPGPVEATLGGKGPLAFRLDSTMPIRGDTKKPWIDLAGSGIPVKLNIFGPPFGDDPKVRADASPIEHVQKGLPPFLIFVADHDLPILGGQADEFHAALCNVAGQANAERIEFRGSIDDRMESQRRLGEPSVLVRVHQRNHNSVMFSANQAGDPVAWLTVDFIRKTWK